MEENQSSHGMFFQCRVKNLSYSPLYINVIYHSYMLGTSDFI